MVESFAKIANKTIFSKTKEIASPPSTIGVQTIKITKLNKLSKTDIVIWDFAGQLEYANNHQVLLPYYLTKLQYFLSSRNVVYLLVVDISIPLETQKEHIHYWIQYLQTQIPKIDDVSIIIIGNKEDLVSNSQSQLSIDYFTSLQKNFALKYIIVSAKNLQNVKPLLKMIKKKCLELLNRNDYFQVPHVYKLIGNHLKSLAESQILLGNQTSIVKPHRL